MFSDNDIYSLILVHIHHEGYDAEKVEFHHISYLMLF